MYDDCQLPGFFELPVMALVIVTILNDGCMISIAYDRVKPSKTPESWASVLEACTKVPAKPEPENHRSLAPDPSPSPNHRITDPALTPPPSLGPWEAFCLRAKLV